MCRVALRAALHRARHLRRGIAGRLPAPERLSPRGRGLAHAHLADTEPGVGVGEDVRGRLGAHAGFPGLGSRVGVGDERLAHALCGCDVLQLQVQPARVDTKEQVIAERRLQRAKGADSVQLDARRYRLGLALNGWSKEGGRR